MSLHWLKASNPLHVWFYLDSMYLFSLKGRNVLMSCFLGIMFPFSLVENMSWELHCDDIKHATVWSRCYCGFPPVSRLSFIVQRHATEVRLTGRSKLTICVTVCGCLSLYQPCDDLGTCLGYTLLFPNVNLGPAPPATPFWDYVENEWMNELSCKYFERWTTWFIKMFLHVLRPDLLLRVNNLWVEGQVLTWLTCSINPLPQLL